MPTQQEKIIKKAREILENSPNGIRYMELVNKIHEAYPEIKIKVIQWNVYDLHKRIKGVVKPERGIFILEKFMKEKIELSLKEARKDIEKIEKLISKEENFYQPFADYLVNELEECTKAIPLGGKKFKDKWGTPDVLGIYKLSETSPIKPLPEIISAEIKTDIRDLITAFGQACSYKIFSHKVYLVIPEDTPSYDLSRLESLCLAFGIGLIIFDKQKPNNPNFKILVRAIKSEPDYFYVNNYLRNLSKEEIDKLF
jgi:hypothetical protein